MKQWDLDRKVVIADFDLGKLRQADPNALHLINPPYVYSIATHNDRSIWSAGLGDGSIILGSKFTKRKKKQWKLRTLSGNSHTMPVGALYNSNLCIQC